LRSNCQAGLAILDTKEIGSVPLDKLVKTYNFAKGMRWYVEKARTEFTFGDSTTAVTVSELSSSIQALIPPFRNVIFVGHGMFNDLQALHRLGIRFPIHLSAILDTLHIAREVLGYCVGSLGKLLNKVGCPHQGLHCAGNDAHFTLEALLLLAAKGLEKPHQDLDMINMLQQIGNEETPRSFDPEVIARDKKWGNSKKQRLVRSDLDLFDDIVALGRQTMKDMEHGTKKAVKLTEAFNRKHARF
jgi:DNA polymerase III alpha subunit (gram-positive type)